MSEWVLGDADVERMWREFLVKAVLWPHDASKTPWDFARAVEQAVLARLYAGKAPADIAFKVVNSMGGYQVMAGCVTEREARRRERAAWDAAFRWLADGGRLPLSLFSPESTYPERDRLYPPEKCDKCGQEIK